MYSMDLKKGLSLATLAILVLSILAIVPMIASAVKVDETPDYAKAGDTVPILSFDIKGRATGMTLTSVTIEYTGTAVDDISTASIYVSGTPFGEISSKEGEISGSVFIPAGAWREVLLELTLDEDAAHGNLVDAKVTAYTTSKTPARGSDLVPIDPEGYTIIDNTDPTVTVSIPAYLESGASGDMEWTTADKKYGSYSVMLDIPNLATEDAYAEVWVPVSIPLGDLDLAGTYFWCKSIEGDWTPYFLFELETGDSINTDAFSEAGYVDWAQYIAADSPEFQWPDGTWHSWADTVDEFGAETLVSRVYVELSGLQNTGEADYGPFTSYVDDITVACNGENILFPLDLVLRGGASYNITWIATDGEDFTLDDELLINLEYSPDGGTTWVLITANQSNDGAYAWTLPLIDSDEVLVRLTTTDLAGNQGSDVSDEFTIDSPPTISALTPPDGAYTTDTTPTISATLADALSGINDTTIVMEVDGVVVVHIYDPVTGEVSYTPVAPLAGGVHTVSVDVSDLAGSPATEEWSFTVVTVYTPVVTSVDVTASPTTVNADGVDYSTMTATVKDQVGNPMEGVTVNFTTTLGTLSAPSDVTDVNGEATVTLTSTVIGTATVTAKADSIIDSVEVQFIEPQVEDAIATLEDLKIGISDLSLSDFKGLTDKVKEQRRDVLLKKVDVVIKQIEKGAYTGAMNKLEKDIKEKLDCDGEGDWLVLSPTDPEVVEMLGEMDLTIAMLGI